jgi:very-short-patch-repair endonuclease
MRTVHNLSYLIDRRKKLRNNPTNAETVLWRYLKNSQLLNRKFRRQHSIKNYIVDFYCVSERVVVELDGDIHLVGNNPEYDKIRNEFLENMGIKVLRFRNNEVLKNIDNILDIIKSNFNTSPNLSLSEERDTKLLQ